ncbi:MAG: SIMPL domain-containing protein [Candidatus Gastranaerophilales bacterium]|nr:SIMPL domain-containing protein [Candidatus Gastranaerophilales bacterium]
MKKLILLLTALLFFQNISYSAPLEKVTEQRGYISTHSEKTKDVYPNIAEITFTKENTAKTIEQASTENKAVIADIKKVLEKFKADYPNTTEIRTGSYSANPNYTYTKNNKRQITGYTVVNSVTVKTKATEQLGKMIDAAIKAGADRVGSLSFSFENDGTICKELINLATKEAYDMATQTASAAKETIKGVKSVNTGCYTQMHNTSNFRNYSAKMMAADGETAEPETSVTPGKIKVRATVNADFYVK